MRKSIAVRTAGVSLLLLLLAVACYADSGSSEAASSVSDAMVPAIFLILVLVPLLLFIVRRLMIRQVNQQMMAASPDQEAVVVEELQSPEEDAVVLPEISLDEADLTTNEMSELCRRREQAEQRLFRKTALADLGIAVVYAVVGAATQNFPLFLVGLGFVLFTVMRYLLHRKRFHAFDLSRSRNRQRFYQRMARVRRVIFFLLSLGTGASVSNVEYAPEVLRGIFGLRMRLVLSVAMIAGTAICGIAILPDQPLVGVSLFFVAALHAGVFAVLAQKMREVPGIKLLILRVFNIDATSSFTFSGLMGYWRYFGNYFTVVDASLLRQDYAHRKWSDAFLLLSSYVTLLMLSMTIIGRYHIDRGPLGWLWCCLLVVVLALLPAWAFLAIERRRIAGHFLRNREQLLGQLQQLKRYPRHLDLSFQHIQANCHDNTWFMAVVEFARCADVVLMDLRGYSEQRKGCQREVDFLFDVVPVERLLFLVDTATNSDLVQAMLVERWRQLRHTSPNLHRTAPVVHLYVARDNDERDMQALLDRLIATAEDPTAAHVAAETAQA